MSELIKKPRELKRTKELDKMLERLDKKLNEAKEVRYEIENYLENHYGIDVIMEAEYLEDDCFYCYGFDDEHISKIIQQKNDENFAAYHVQQAELLGNQQRIFIGRKENGNGGIS